MPRGPFFVLTRERLRWRLRPSLLLWSLLGRRVAVRFSLKNITGRWILRKGLLRVDFLSFGGAAWASSSFTLALRGECRHGRGAYFWAVWSCQSVVRLVRYVRQRARRRFILPRAGAPKPSRPLQKTLPCHEKPMDPERCAERICTPCSRDTMPLRSGRSLSFSEPADPAATRALGLRGLQKTCRKVAWVSVCSAVA